jgi:5-methylcytosine-specific restriction protein A
LAEVDPPALFVVGQVYRRRDLHLTYGGQWQGGISTPSSSPLIFLFTGDTGHQYGYRDGRRPDGTYWYTGEGQEDDMRMERGNLSILNHEKEGKDLHLFEAIGRGMVRYVGSAVCLGYREEAAPDRNGTPRKAIVFELDIDGGAEGQIVTPDARPREVGERRLWSEPIEKLRARTLDVPEQGVSAQDRKQRVYKRSEAVRVYVLRRSEGVCEGCGQPAPFKRPDGTPYLEPHHLRRLADAGPDHPRWVAALCPNCHRRVHSGEDRTDYNKKISEHISQLEG